MRTMIGDIALFLAAWLVLWALLMASYVTLLAVVDFLKSRWRRFRRTRQYRRAVDIEMVRIDREAAASVLRIGAAFAIAQQLIQEEAAASRDASR
jgi:biopolymer transport protein ExbB/TolQ